MTPTPDFSEKARKLWFYWKLLPGEKVQKSLALALRDAYETGIEAAAKVGDRCSVDYFPHVIAKKIRQLAKKGN